MAGKTKRGRLARAVRASAELGGLFAEQAIEYICDLEESDVDRELEPRSALLDATLKIFGGVVVHTDYRENDGNVLASKPVGGGKKPTSP